MVDDDATDEDTDVAVDPTGTPTETTGTPPDTIAIRLRSPRLALPAAYCATNRFDAQFGVEEADAVVATWDQLATGETLFERVESCTDAALEFDYDDEQVGPVQSHVLEPSDGVRVVLTAGSPDFSATDREVAKNGCPSSLHYSVTRLLAHEMGHGLGFPHSCEQGDPCADDDAANALMFWVTPLNCAPTRTSDWDAAALSLALGSN